MKTIKTKRDVTIADSDWVEPTPSSPLEYKKVNANNYKIVPKIVFVKIFFSVQKDTICIIFKSSNVLYCVRHR